MFFHYSVPLPGEMCVPRKVNWITSRVGAATWLRLAEIAPTARGRLYYPHVPQPSLFCDVPSGSMKIVDIHRHPPPAPLWRV